MYNTIYFHRIKISPSPATFAMLIFANVVKVTISSMQSFNTRQKNSMIKFSPMRAGGKIGEIFLLVKISTYMYTVLHSISNKYYTRISNKLRTVKSPTS